MCTAKLISLIKLNLQDRHIDTSCLVFQNQSPKLPDTGRRLTNKNEKNEVFSFLIKKATERKLSP